MTGKKETKKHTPASLSHHRIDRLAKVCSGYRQNRQSLIAEIEQLKNDNRTLANSLKEAKYHLGRIHSEIDEEMETAQHIQEGLLPQKLPEMINLQSAAKYIPAGKVGGDLYDIIITPRQKIALLIYDVSGHGIPAALIAAMAKMLFAHYIEKNDSPAEVFDAVNRQLCQFIQTEQYLTAFLGILDPVNNVLTYSRAGHVPPLVYHAKDDTVSRLDSKGFFIGHSALLPVVEYEDEAIRLDPDDKLLLYTDGLTEGNNENGALYGSKRLREAYSRCGRECVQGVIDFVVDDQEQFREGTELRDDFTLLCIQIGDSERLLSDCGFSHEDEPSILVASEIKEIDGVCSIILREMDRHGFLDSAIKQFKICIFEMITNAILHGNNSDITKKVLVFYKITRAEAAISVVDEGDGFDYDAVPDPLSPENMIRDHGRGVFLIRHYLDSVEFNKKGNRVLGRKRQGTNHGNSK